MNAPESLFILANIIQKPQQFVVKCRVTEFNSRISSNFVRVIGTGERCLPGDADNCGDGGKATDARLSYPKGEYIINKYTLLSAKQRRYFVSHFLYRDDNKNATQCFSRPCFKMDIVTDDN